MVANQTKLKYIVEVHGMFRKKKSFIEELAVLAQASLYSRKPKRIKTKSFKAFIT